MTHYTITAKTPLILLRGENNYIVFGLINLTICNTQGEHVYHYTTEEGYMNGYGFHSIAI